MRSSQANFPSEQVGAGAGVERPPPTRVGQKRSRKLALARLLLVVVGGGLGGCGSTPQSAIPTSTQLTSSRTTPPPSPTTHVLAGTLTEFPAGGQVAGFCDPEGITRGPDGNVWFTDNPGKIGRLMYGK